MFFSFLSPRPTLHVLFAIILTSGWLHAAPYGPGGKEIEWTQPDGSKLTLRVFGDEYYGRTATLDGFTVVFDSATKTYHYATLSPDGNEFASSGKAVGKADPKALGLGKRIEINPASRAAKARQNHDAHEVVVKQQARWDAVKAASKNYESFKKEVRKQEKAGKKGFVIPMGTVFPDSVIPATPSMVSPASGAVTGSGSTSIAPGPPSTAITGSVVGLTILVDFSDVPGTVVTQAQVDDLCNKPNYTGFSNAGSVYDYYFIQSGGSLRYNNNVTYYVRLPQPKTYYNDTSIANNAGSCGQLLVNDAVTVLLANGYDFSKLSTKSGGYVRACNVFFAGADSGVWSAGLWPHRSAITPRGVGGGKYIYDYQISEIGTTPSLNIGTFCHENGHMLLGYPDLYSYDGNAAGVGMFSLMDGGNYGGSPAGTHPVNIDPYLKAASGWMDVIELNSASHQRCTLQADGNQLYRYRNPSKTQEYFLFEVRDNTGYEGVYGGSSVSVNPSAGLVAYHALETGSNTRSSIWTINNPACSYATPYELLVVEANPTATPTPWYDKPSPDANDAFKAAGKNAISDTTTPALKFWDGTGRNTVSGCDINSISADSSTMTFVVGAGAPSGTPNIVLSRSTIDSSCDHGTTAPSQTFNICNGQGGMLNYTISDDQTWLSCTPASGTATTESDAITVNFSTNGLAAGSYSAIITVTDPAASPTTATISVSLTVAAQPVLAVSPATITVNGTAGLSVPQTSFTINNTGGGALSYTLSSTQPWLSLSSTSGTVVSETDVIYVSLNATSLSRGTYTDTITVTAPSASNSPLSIPVTFIVDGADMILSAPNGGESWSRGTTQTITWSSGIAGNVKIELLKNGVLNTTISASTPNDGSFSWSIPSGQTIGSNYHIRVTSVETPAVFDQSYADFTITSPPTPFYYASMDTDPGWTRDSGWGYGHPTGTAQDPTSGFNGSNVIGYNLTGAYANSIATTLWATTPAINCSSRKNVKLSFQRWLGVETSAYDHAYIEVSNNGTTWTQVWANPASDTNDTSWTYCEYDISAVADGKNTVYIRWGLGTTDSLVTFCGWNLDEVTLSGVPTDNGYTAVITQSGGSTDVTEGGATDTYTVKLSSQPTANVKVNITNDSQVTVSPTSFTFNAANWNTAQTVTVTAVNDSLNEFAHTGTINHIATSTDANYNAVAIDGVLVNITDNDNVAPVSNAGPDQTVYLINIWSPADLNPIAWYDATDTATITAPVSGSVSQWKSKAGTSHMLQATPTKQPKTGTNQINGLNSIAFDGVDDALKTASNPFGASISNAMMMGVFNIGTIDTGTLFSLTGTGTDANRWQSHAPYSNGNLYFDCGGINTPNRISAPTGWSASQNKMLGYYCSTTDSVQQVWVDGTNFVSDASGHTVNTNSGIALGHEGAAGYDNCTMGEVVILNGTVSTLNRQKLEGHLAHKWGLQASLPADHPYKNQSPTYTLAVANLDGTISDANGDALTTLWTVVSGPGLVTFGNANAVDTTATFTLPGTYTLRLSTSDPGVTTSDDVVITVSTTSGFVVSYNSNGSTGGTAPNSQVKSTGVNLTLATNGGSLVRSGYTYAGWNTAANGSGADYAPGTTYSTDANLALFAKWTPNTYTVTFNVNGGSAPSPTSKSVTFNAAYGALATTSRTNYTFNGWFTAAFGGTQITNLTSVSTAADHTLYAQWTGNPYTVTFNENGGIAASPTSKTVNLGTAYGTLAITNRTGYAFNGWFTAASGGTQVTDVTNVTTAANHTLYAQWSIATYAVTYDGNGNTGGTVPSNQTKTHDIAFTLSGVGTLTRAGCTFTGWNTATNGSGTSYAVGATYTANAALELYAQWYAVPLANAGSDQLITLSGASWSPADAGPLAWYDATDSATITQVSGAVSQWADKIGSNNMVQATPGNQPLSGIVGNQINGLNTIAFNGSSHALKTSTNPFGASISNAMLIGVFNIGTIADSTLFSLSSSGTSRWQSHAPWSDKNLYFDCGGSSGANRVFKASGWSASQTKMLGYYCSTTDNVQQVWVDGTNFVSDASGHTVATAGGIALGHDGGTSYDNCSIGEVVVINGTVSATNRQKLEGYLAHKWGLAGNLPAGHPYKSQSPSNIAAVANLTGTATDPNGDPLTTTWTVVSGPGSVAFGNANAVNTTATFTVAGTYTLRLTASDPLASTTDDVIITVKTTTDFTVTYAGNNPTGGTPPTNQVKVQGVNLTLATNSGTLVKTGYIFTGWNTAADGSGTNYAVGATYTTDANLTLYAKWTTAYVLWAGVGKPSNGDSNGDGIADGMAWLLGATSPTQNATALVPSPTVNSGNLVVDFKYLNATKRGSAILKLQYSKDLDVTDKWVSHTVTVPDMDSTVGGVAFTITAVPGDPDLYQVKATVPSSAADAGGKIFMRLTGEIP